jgi:colanic acid/amylovoran biosynthesis glycosyltransferase
VVHSHFANIGWRHRQLASALGALHVVSFYGWDYEYLPTIRPQWKARMQQLFEQADLLVCEGPHGAGVLARLGCAQHKIRVCHLGVEPQRIPMYRREKGPGELRLLQIAAFREKKGHLYTVRAFAEAAVRCPEATLTLVGSGDATIIDEVNALVAAAGLQDRVTLVPGIDFSRLHESMRDFHVFIHPSLHTEQKDCEGGAPIVLLDAQATGMPVISTLHCDIPGEVVDGSTGLLVAECDVAALAQAICRFYQMGQDEYDGFGARARAHVSAEFDVATCSERLAGLYADAIQTRAPHSP